MAVLYIKLVSKMQTELRGIQDDASKATLLMEQMKADNLDLVTDFSQKKNHV